AACWRVFSECCSDMSSSVSVAVRPGPRADARVLVSLPIGPPASKRFRALRCPIAMISTLRTPATYGFRRQGVDHSGPGWLDWWPAERGGTCERQAGADQRDRRA